MGSRTVRVILTLALAVVVVVVTEFRVMTDQPMSSRYARESSDSSLTGRQLQNASGVYSVKVCGIGQQSGIEQHLQVNDLQINDLPPDTHRDPATSTPPEREQ